MECNPARETVKNNCSWSLKPPQWTVRRHIVLQIYSDFKIMHLVGDSSTNIKCMRYLMEQWGRKVLSTIVCDGTITHEQELFKHSFQLIQLTLPGRLWLWDFWHTTGFLFTLRQNWGNKKERTKYVIVYQMMFTTYDHDQDWIIRIEKWYEIVGKPLDLVLVGGNLGSNPWVSSEPC